MAELLKNDAELIDALEKKKEEDEAFAKSARSQLDFIYKRSPYYESTHNLYPVGRVVNEVELPLK